MNLKAVTLAAILGIATPTLIDIAVNHQVIAAPPFPSGDFGDRAWLITLTYENNVHRYHGWNLETDDTIDLAGAKVSGDRQRWIYTWSNNGYRYQVAWRPSDPNFIRVQVFSPSGKQILNRLLQKQTQGIGG